jgi:protoporphyrinogen oxidase
MRVLVVGAGPAGLTAALLAAEAGHEVVVVEACERLGGMAASIEVGDQRADLGSHRLHPAASDRVLGLLGRLLGDDLQVRTRNGRIRLADRWVRFPLSAVDLARNLPPRFVGAALRDAVVSPLRREREDTYAEVVRAGLGPAALDWFHGPYAQKLWGRSPDRLAGDLARRRIAVSSPGRLAAKLIRSARRGPGVFLYPRRGYGQVVEALAGACVASGVAITTGEQVLGVTPSEGEGPVRVTSDSGRLHEVDRVLWTAPPAVLSAVAGGPEWDIPAHRALILVYLVLDVDRYTPFDAHYFPGADVRLARLSEPKNYRDGDDPGGRTVLCAEIACGVGDGLWSASEEELVAEVTDALSAADLPRPSVVGSHVERLPSVYPVLGPEDVGRATDVSRWAQQLGGVTVLGRQGLMVADNIHHVMDMAFDAVACLGGSGGWDDLSWRAALRRFESHVVED